MRGVIALVLAACGGDSSRARVEPLPPEVKSPGEPIVDGGAVPEDATSQLLDGGAAPIHAVDGGEAVLTLNECFCFSWVHLCRSAQRPRCGGHACRNIGKDCVQLY